MEDMVEMVMRNVSLQYDGQTWTNITTTTAGQQEASMNLRVKSYTNIFLVRQDNISISSIIL